MLSAKKNRKKILEPGSTQNRINEGTILKGDISSEGYFRIDGHIEGSIQTPSKVVIGKAGVIKGSLRCENADIEGKLEGTIEVSETLTLRSTARIEGDIIVGKLAVEQGAILNATCVMIDPDSPLSSQNPRKSQEKEKKLTEMHAEEK